MARTTETIVRLTDDVDGSSDGVETISFALDGTAYEIDLGPKNAKQLRNDLATWVGHARKAKRDPGRARRTGGSKPTGEAAAIREWAAANGIAVPARGRIPAAIAEQYHSA